MDILDLGCGKNKTPGAFGVDHKAFDGVDLVHDLNAYPYPLPDNAYDKIVVSHIVEHLDDVVRFFEEIHRIARPGAKVQIVTPHFSNRSAYADPTHRHAFSVRFLDFLCGSKPRPLSRFAITTHYLLEHRFVFEPMHTPPLYKSISLDLSFSRIFRWFQIRRLANHWLDLYEFYLAFLFPARDITATLEVIKEGR